MKRILLHIGQTKTGTKALQKFCELNAEHLRNNGVLYYRPLNLYRRWSVNAAFVHALAMQALGMDKGLFRNPLKEEIANLKRETEGCETLLLSDEYLFEANICHGDYWRVIRDELRNIFGEGPEIDIVLYLRRQDEWIFSHWKQQLIHLEYPTRLDFPSFYQESSAWLDYDGLLQKLENVFGSSHVIVGRYDKNAFYGNDLYRDFFHTADLPWDKAFTLPLKLTHSSLTADAAEVVLWYNRHQQDDDESLRKINYTAHVFSILYPEKKALHPLTKKERSELLAGCSEGNANIAGRYFREDALFSSDIPDGPVWMPDPERFEKNRKIFERLMNTPRSLTETMIRMTQLPSVTDIPEDIRKRFAHPDDMLKTYSPPEYLIKEDSYLVYLINSKAACTSITSAFLDENDPEDYSVHDIIRKRHMIKRVLPLGQDFFVFSFVRNPFSRLVSCYEEKKERRRKPGWEKHDFYEYLDGYFSSVMTDEYGFEDFVDMVCRLPDHLMERHIKLQYDLLFTDGGICRCGFIGHFETLKEDYAILQKRFPLRDLPHLNRSREVNWADYYTPELAEKVFLKYRKDFEAFGYLESYHALLRSFES